MSRHLTAVPRDPHDPRHQLLQNLELVRSGRWSRAPGIRRCPGCDEPWIADDSGLTWCEVCRVGKHRRCAGCRTVMAITEAGERLCDSCTHQQPLF